MALPMHVLTTLRKVNARTICRVDHHLRAFHWTKPSRFHPIHSVRTHNVKFFSQSTSLWSSHDEKQPQSDRPGLLKRLLHKSDDIFCAVLGRISPWMLQEYGHFKIGLVKFTGDVKTVYYINKKIRKENLQLGDLHWKELYLKKQMSNDLAKVAPTMLLLSLPIVYYFVLPLMFIYPTVFLSNQFLSHDKLLKYYIKSYKQRVELYPMVLELVSQQMGRIQNSKDKQLLQTVIEKEKLDQRASVKEVSETKSAFQTLTLSKLPRNHLKCLCRLCSLRTMFMPGFMVRRKLEKNIAWIQAMDHSIMKEGISTLEHLDLEKLCYERGLNTVHLDKSALETWLGEWMELSSQTTEMDRSLVAHSMALLVMGHPSCHQLHDINLTANPTEDKSSE
ncbi:LETM1 domain-containing protein 1-like [Asterias amurensis]|uniref:LETM1 domain-containing protein 1-like n=1 Tax=Asterias amurensis TaxID=7602 RepID=UPI003AB64367